MFDHIGFCVRDLAAARRFYAAIAEPLGLATIDNSDASFLLVRSAQDPIPFVWIGTARPSFWRAGHSASASPIHLCFSVRDDEAVAAFHRVALAAGGIDNGAPGPRGPKEMNYYAAYALDPDGNNVEAGRRG